MRLTVYKPFLIGILILLIIFGTNRVFQNKFIYNKTIGRYIIQYQNINGERKVVDKSFEGITNENMVRWDAAHYLFIRDHSYDTKLAGGDYIFGFFPLFPLIWKISFLSPVGIGIFNYLLFVLGLIFIFKELGHGLDKKENILKYILLLTLPGTVIFYIPYTEALFFIVICIAFYGMLKNKYSYYFVGMFLCSLTRPSAVIIGASIVCKDIYLYLTGIEKEKLLKKIFRNIIPVVLGTMLIGLYQYSFDHTSLFNFQRVGAYWGHKLQIPRDLTDWSHEGFSMNIALIFLLIPTLICFLLKGIIVKGDTMDVKYPLFILSTFYLVGIFLFILLYQGGNLHGLSRYLLCTPFFFVVVIWGYQKMGKSLLDERLALIVFPLFAALFIYTLSPYMSKWSFYSLGLLILFLNYFYLFNVFSTAKLFNRLFFGSIVVVNIIWNAYLLNCYLNDGWIFA